MNGGTVVPPSERDASADGPTRGIVYLAMGERFVAEAAVSAASARRHLRVPITIFTDCPAAARSEGCFDDVVELARSAARPHRDKIVAMRRTPYARTLFLDTDTFIGAPLEDCWDLLDRFDMAAAGDRGYVDAFPPGTDVPASFKEPNLGVVFYRSCPAVQSMLDEALLRYDALAACPAEKLPRPVYDQTAVRLALFFSGVRLAALADEDNCRFANYGKLNGPVRVVHGRLLRAAHDGANLQRVIERLNTTTAPRVFVAGRVWALWPRRRRLTQQYRAVAMPSANVVDAGALVRALAAKMGLVPGREEAPAESVEALRSSPRPATVPPPALVAACLLAVYFIWGSTYLAIRIAVTALPPFLMAGLRTLTAGTLLLLWVALRGAPLPSRERIVNAAGVGILLLAGGNGLVTFAEQWVSSSLTAAVVASGSIWIVLMLAVLGERPTRLEAAGVVVGFAGVVMLNMEGEMRAHPVGALALLGATLCWALGSVLSRRVALPDGATAVTVEMLAAGAVMTAFGLATGERIDIAALTPKAAGAWLYLVTAGSLVGFSAFSFLIRNVRPALATSFAYINPAVALLLGVALGGEHMGRLGYGGVAVAILGVAMLTLGRKPAG